MSITHEELLAKCPKLRELRESHEELAEGLTAAAVTNPFYIGPNDPDVARARALGDFDAALDELIERMQVGR